MNSDKKWEFPWIKQHSACSVILRILLFVKRSRISIFVCVSWPSISTNMYLTLCTSVNHNLKWPIANGKWVCSKYETNSEFHKHIMFTSSVIKAFKQHISKSLVIDLYFAGKIINSPHLSHVCSSNTYPGDYKLF